jgi:hypothetical protein
VMAEGWCTDNEYINILEPPDILSISGAQAHAWFEGREDGCVGERSLPRYRPGEEWDILQLCRKVRLG